VITISDGVEIKLSRSEVKSEMKAGFEEEGGR
jgi:hypothetical protein